MSDIDMHYDEREQSEIKHYTLRLYLEVATLILGSTKNLSFRYVDCCAGPWMSSATDLSDTSFAIAIETLKKAAKTLADRGVPCRFSALLIEEKVSAFAQLKAFAKQSATPSLPIQALNSDFTKKLTEIVDYCSALGAFPFIFIDPTGWQLAGISKIRPLLQLKRGEVLINLMSSFIGRFIMDHKTDFTDLLGADFPSLRTLSGAELESAIVGKYCELVKREGGFKYVCSLPVMNPDMDSFKFHLIYATRHRKGVEVFKNVERRTEARTHAIRAELQQKDRQSKSGNLELFTSDVQYKNENCYQRLVRTNKERARVAVRSLVEGSSQISYDECWGEALQFSGVHEIDLRTWIETWALEGSIVVHGKASKARSLQVGKGVTLARSARE